MAGHGFDLQKLLESVRPCPWQGFGFEAAAPWVWGSIQFSSRQPCGGLSLSSPLGFFTVGSVSACDWCVSGPCYLVLPPRVLCSPLSLSALLTQ